ncbi:MAG: hypothetical protein QOI83_193 [Streptomycetaceae bacterium]|nr:hypothetical protein [Streptomycetaceae bacterium]
MAPALPDTAPKIPNALFSSLRSVKITVISDNAVGARIAANPPWTARAVINVPMFGAAPPTAEAIANPSSPTMNMALRPYASASRPPSGSKLPNAST